MVSNAGFAICDAVCCGCFCPNINRQHAVIYRLPGPARRTIVTHVRECRSFAEVNDSIQKMEAIEPYKCLYRVTLSWAKRLLQMPTWKVKVLMCVHQVHTSITLSRDQRPQRDNVCNVQRNLTGLCSNPVYMAYFNTH